MSVAQADHANNSVLREVILEHQLTASLLKALWRRGIFDAEVLHSSFDRGGYDLVLSRGGVTRHIQLKASREGGAAAFQTISLALAARPAGCVVWMIVDDTLEVRQWLFLGGGPGTPLPLTGSERVARHTKADATGHKGPRPGLRRVPRGAFRPLADIDALLEQLLGPLP